MPNRFSPDEVAALPQVLSAPRFATYIAARGSPLPALSLYHWNAQVSAAFLFPLHIYEICIRNAAANAIEGYYHANWPWAKAFETSLPNPMPPHFSPRRELLKVRDGKLTAGQVIGELKFAFWESIYTKRHDGRLWNTSALGEFRNLPPGTTPQAARKLVHASTGAVRALRNRIAHHEPIFARDLVSDYQTIHDIILYKCRHTAGYVSRSQGVTNLLALKP